MQINQIRRFLNFVFAAGDLYEIRALGSETHGTMRWLGDHLVGAAIAAVEMEKRGGNVYYALNPVGPQSSYATQTPRNKPYLNVRRTMTDKAAACRNLYLIDVDPVRPAGTAATDAQRESARSTAEDVQAFLSSREWPEPIRIDSGNGIHLLYKGDRCPADGRVLKHALGALAKSFNAECKVDQSVFNAARIARLPYTWNSKAKRRSAVISYPAEWEPLAAERVLHLAVEGGYQSTPDERQHESAAVRQLSRDATDLSVTQMHALTLPAEARPTPAGSKLLIDVHGVQRLIGEYPEHLMLDGITARESTIFFSLAVCPFKGTPHRGQDIGSNKSCILLRPDGIGFKCFSDDCSHLTFLDLLRHLRDQTGRWTSVAIWEEDWEALETRWGGIDYLV